MRWAKHATWDGEREVTLDNGGNLNICRIVWLVLIFKVSTECESLLSLIREVSDSNLGLEINIFFWDYSWHSSVYRGKCPIIASHFALQFHCPVVTLPCTLYIWSYLTAVTERSDNPYKNIHCRNNLNFQAYFYYVPHSLTFTNSAFCPHSVFMCFVWISEQTAIISLYNINCLVFITETESV
jgi:hypothetical protein